MNIRTRRFLLRDFRDQDLDPFVAYHSNARFLKYYSDENAKSDHARQLIKQFQTWAQEVPRVNYQLAITLAASGDLVGCAGLRGAEEPEGTAELGIELASEYWGRYGFAVEVLVALASFGFDSLNLASVYGETVSANANIGKLLAALGAEPSEKSTPNWMSAKGWRQLEWNLSRDAWQSKRLTNTLRQRFSVAPSGAA